jgi:hypothetical protein
MAARASGAHQVVKRGTLVLVTWLDAHAESGWGPVKDVDIKPDTVLSVGWVISHTDVAIVIAADVDVEALGRKKDVNRTMLIPIGMVLGIREVTG